MCRLDTDSYYHHAGCQRPLCASQYVSRDVYCDVTDVYTRWAPDEGRRVSRCPHAGHSAGPVYEVRRLNFHGIISGLEGLIAGIKSEECKLNR